MASGDDSLPRRASPPDEVVPGAECTAAPLDEVRRRLDALRARLTGGPEPPDPDLHETLHLLARAHEDLETRERELETTRRTLRTAERDSRDLFELAPDGYLLTDTEGRIVEANRAAEALGLAAATGATLERSVASDHLPTFRARTASLLAGRTARIQDWQIRLEPDGRDSFDCECSVEPRRAASGAVEGLRWLLRDVTERRRAAEALRESEARFRAIYDNAAIGIRVAEAGSGRIVQANRAFQEMMGYSEEELRSRTLFDLTHPDDVEEGRRLFDEVRSEARPDFQVEKRYVRADGSVFWARLTVSPVRDRAGRPAFLIGIVEDVSERRRTERELQDSLTRTQALLDAAIDAIVTIDERGTIETVNPAVERLFGYDAEELRGRNVKILMPEPWHGEHDGYLEHFRRTGDARIIGIGREVMARHSSGREFPVDLGVSEVRLGDRRIFMGILRDITERRRTEEALRQQRDFAQSLIDTARAIVLVLDPDGRVVQFNRYFEELSGVSLDEARGEDWFSRFVPERRREEVRGVFRLAVGPGATTSNVNEIVLRDGTERTIDWSSTTIQDAAGRVTGVLAVGQDVTDRVRLEDQFRQAQKMEAVGRLAGGIAHDFNTLLGSAIGYSELLLRRLPEGSEEARLAAQVLRTGQRGAALTRQLLTFSRRQRREVRRLDPVLVVRELEDMLQRLLGEDVRIVLDAADDVGTIEADRSQLEQVVVNLAVNAGDSMPRGGRLGISLANVRGADDVALGEGSWVRLQVSDAGHGMDAATRERIFEPFFTTKEVGRGTGLGLSTVYAIVEQAGGRIRVDSEEGKGTTIRVYLPRSDAPADEPSSESILAPLPSQPRLDGSVLVVEDDEMFRELIREVLEEAGHTVLTAVAPADALRQLEVRGDEVGLVLTDLVMPGMTGRELAARIHESRPGMPIVFMSGYSGDELVRRELEDEGAPFLSKPFTTRELLDALRQILAGEPG